MAALTAAPLQPSHGLSAVPASTVWTLLATPLHCTTWKIKITTDATLNVLEFVPVWEVHPPNPAICVNLNTQSFHVVCSISSPNGSSLIWLMIHLSLKSSCYLVKSAKLNCIWFQPSSSLIGMVQMKGFTLVVDWRDTIYWKPIRLSS